MCVGAHLKENTLKINTDFRLIEGKSQNENLFFCFVPALGLMMESVCVCFLCGVPINQNTSEPKIFCPSPHSIAEVACI